MKPATLRLAAVLALLFLAASSVQATFYTVTLKNGTTFETRYRPVQAEWDANISMFMTDKGNWIAVPITDIADVVSVFEENGFGYQLDTSTRFIGWSPNDLVEDKVDEDGNVIEESRYEIDEDAGDSGYSIDQFLGYDTPDTVGGGDTSSGLVIGGVFNVGGGGGGDDGNN